MAFIKFSKKLFLLAALAGIFFIFISANVAQAACSYNVPAFGYDCAKIGKNSSSLSNCSGQTVPSACASDISKCECCCDESTGSGSTIVNDSMPNLKMPELQISIPNLTFTQTKNIKCEKGSDGKVKSCQIPWIGEYVAGVYKYAIGIVGILAAVVLMIGGVVWITAGGNATRVGEAKAWIGASLTGLVIALASYTILYQINPSLVNFNPLKIDVVQPLEDLTKKYQSMDCSSITKEELAKGFTTLVTGYCRPKTNTAYGTSSASRKDFLCSVGLNCSCPGNKKGAKNDCCNSKGYCWTPCADFDDKTTTYCNQTAAGGEPGVGQIAADWKCFPKDSTVCIGGKNYKVTDKGSAIKGTRFDVWTDNCSEAYSLTGEYDANAGSCK